MRNPMTTLGVVALALGCTGSGSLPSDDIPELNTGKFPTTRDVFSASSFASRRARLATQVGDGVVVLFAEKGLIDAWDEHVYQSTFRLGAFRQEENLFYLTGLEIPGAAIVIDARANEVFVYVQQVSDSLGRVNVSAAVQAELDRLELGTARPIESLIGDLLSLLRGRPVYLLTRSEEVPSAFGPGQDFAPFLPGVDPSTFREATMEQLFQRTFPRAEIRSVMPAMAELRKVKDAEEIVAMRHAAQISARGLLVGIGVVAPGVDEREVAAAIEYTFKRNGAQLTAYAADVQSGPNSMRSFVDIFATYDLANRTMRAGELSLVDHSAEVNYYASDLARTVPVSGRFSPDQRLAYETYLRAYEAGLAAIGPSVAYVEIGGVVADALLEQLDGLPDWLRGPVEQTAQTMRGRPTGHFIGMNIHIHQHNARPLVPGQVMAYEWALYIPERGWRITVEDMVLVTADGNEVVSAELPRTVARIERAMR